MNSKWIRESKVGFRNRWLIHSDLNSKGIVSEFAKKRKNSKWICEINSRNCKSIISHFAKKMVNHWTRREIVNSQKRNSWWIREEDSKFQVNLLRRWGIHSEFANKIGNYKWICKEVGEFIMNSRKKIWIESEFGEFIANWIQMELLVIY